MLFLIKFIILCPIWDRDSTFFLNSPNFLLFNSKNHQRIHFDEFVTLVLRNVYMELTKSNLQNFCEKISTIFFYTNLSWEFDVFFLFVRMIFPSTNSFLFQFSMIMTNFTICESIEVFDCCCKFKRISRIFWGARKI